MNANVTRIDLHVHTRFSGVCNAWPLREFELLESYTTPRQAYELAKRRGMDYVTITDHDTIRGALELAHLDDFLIGEEITAIFPEDGAKVHVVTLDITESQHREIQDLGTNIYELVEYLNEQEVFHFVAHPFYGMTHLTLDHFEKVLLLFSAFEVKNGGKQLHPDDLLVDLLSGLSAQTIWRLADKHRIKPYGDAPWQKTQVAGSDDHGGIRIGRPHTVTPPASSRQELMARLKRGESRSEGTGGTPFSVAHQILSVAAHHFREKPPRVGGITSRVGIVLLSQVLEQNLSRRLAAEAMASASALHSTLSTFANNGRGRRRLSTQLRLFVSTLYRDRRTKRFLTRGFDFAEGDGEALFKALEEVITDFVHQSDTRHPHPPLELVRRSLVVLPVFIPYLIACKAESRSWPLIREVKHRFLMEPVSERIAVFADSPSRLVAHTFTFQRFLDELPCDNPQIEVFDPSCANLQPLFRVPEVPFLGHDLKIPAVHRMIDVFAKQSFDRFYIHSLGPIGLFGLLSGAFLGVPVSCRFPYGAVKALVSADNVELPSSIARAALRMILSLADQVRVHSGPALKLARSLEIKRSRLYLVDVDYVGVASEVMPSLDEIAAAEPALAG